jgi:protocatechuate 4,5-dioxygenase beta chain
MATIVGGIGVSHVPAIANAAANGLQNDAYWKPFFDGIPPVRAWLRRVEPDVAIVIYNDHGLNFFLDKQPTFAIGAAPDYRTSDEGWGLPDNDTRFTGDVQLSWHLIEALIGDEFDLTTCQEMLVDHAFVNPLNLFWPQGLGALRTIPVVVNTIQYPLPHPDRCLRLGRAIGRAVASYPADLRVVILGTGGLSHQLEGTRAGFINRDFDQFVLSELVANPEAISAHSVHDIVRLAGSQGIEVVNWLAMRGALGAHVTRVHQNYHVPISNTASGLTLLQSD